MNTELYKIDEHNIDAAAKEILKKAGDIIKEGGLLPSLPRRFTVLAEMP